MRCFLGHGVPRGRGAAGLSALAAALVLLAASATALEPGETRNASVLRVIDGDTFVIAGGTRVRVRNFDAPELRRYECLEERAMARRARQVARTLLLNRVVTLRVADRDRYRRLVADVEIHRGRARVDFVAEMTAAGVGARWRYGEEAQPSWCFEELARLE